jgi:hypothetical protein
MKILVLACFWSGPFEYPYRVCPGGIEMHVQDLIGAMIDLDHDVHVLVPSDSDLSFCSIPNVHLSECNSKCVNGVKTRTSHVKRFEDIRKLDEAYDFDIIWESNPLHSNAILRSEHEKWVSKMIFVQHTRYIRQRPEILGMYLVKRARKLGAYTLAVSKELIDLFETFPFHDKAFLVGKDPEEYYALGKMFGADLCIHYTKDSDLSPAKNNGLKGVVIARNVADKRLGFNLNLAKKYGYDLTVFTDSPRGLKGGNILIGKPHSEIMKSLPSFSFAVSTATKETTGIANFEYATYGLPVIHESPCSSEFLSQIGADYFGLDNLTNIGAIIESHNYQAQYNEIRKKYDYDNFCKRIQNVLDAKITS